MMQTLVLQSVNDCQSFLPSNHLLHFGSQSHCIIPHKPRHRVTCGSKRDFSCFGHLLLHVICPKVLVLKSVLSMYIV